MIQADGNQGEEAARANREAVCMWGGTIGAIIGLTVVQIFVAATDRLLSCMCTRKPPMAV